MHNILVRMVIYILSPIITAAVALISGWGVTYNAVSHVLSLDLPALIGAIVGAVGLSGAVLAWWGIHKRQLDARETLEYPRQSLGGKLPCGTAHGSCGMTGKAAVRYERFGITATFAV